VEERGAGNLHATFCGNRGRATAPGDPVAGLRCPAPLTYLHAYASVPEARAGIGAWLNFYNEERLHQAHGYRTPRQIYEEQCPWTGSAAPNGSASPVSRAGSGNGEMLTFMPTGISNNKDLEIENIAVTLRRAPTPIPSI